MRNEGLDALLLRVPENVAYISDAWFGQGLTYLVFPLEKDPILIHPASETPSSTWVSDVREFSTETPDRLSDVLDVGVDFVGKALTDTGMSSGTVGVEDSWELVAGTYARYETNVVGERTLSAFKGKITGCEWKNASPLLIKARAIKTPKEVRMLKKANAVAEIGLRVFERNLKPGLTEIQLATSIEHEIVASGMLKHRANRVVACAFIASGSTTAEAHRYAFGSTRRKLRRGDLVMLELDVIADGYSSDTTRTFVVGKPNRLQKRLFEAVLDSQTTAISAIKPNVAAAEIARISNDVIRRHGFAEYLVHGLGHGIGLAIHESIPTLHLESKDVLQPGMVHSIEPGIYGQRIGGVRIEDDILDTERGAEYLSTYQRIPE
jgi:Xaa-Pro aminopeptidase